MEQGRHAAHRERGQGPRPQRRGEALQRPSAHHPPGPDHKIVLCVRREIIC